MPSQGSISITAASAIPVLQGQKGEALLRKSSVLRSPQACSDHKAPPELYALSGFDPFRSLHMQRPGPMDRVFVMAGAEGIEPSARGFGDRCSTS